MLGKASEMNNVWRNRFCHISLNQNARACIKGESVMFGKAREMTAVNNVWKNRTCPLTKTHVLAKKENLLYSENQAR